MLKTKIYAICCFITVSGSGLLFSRNNDSNYQLVSSGTQGIFHFRAGESPLPLAEVFENGERTEVYVMWCGETRQEEIEAARPSLADLLGHLGQRALVQNR